MTAGIAQAACQFAERVVRIPERYSVFILVIDLGRAPDNLDP